jgi:hypothetical protein
MSEPAEPGRGVDDRRRPADSTVLGIRRSEKGWLARWARWTAILVLVAVVGIGATGQLGVHTAQASATGGGYLVTVTYASVARAGLDAPLRVQVDREDGRDFDGDITLDLAAGYLSIFESQGFLPDPDSSTGLDDTVRMTFEAPPEGSRFVVNYDAYIQPAAQLGTDGQISLVVDNEPVATVEFHTTLLP